MIIELGNVTDEEPAATPEPPVDSRRLRPVLLALIVVLALLAVTGSIPPARPALQKLFSVPFTGDTDTVAFDRNTLYLGHNAGHDSSLTAYDLGSGRARWTGPGNGTIGTVGPPAGGVLLVPTEQGDAGIAQDDGTFVHSTVAIDTTTGRELWRSSGFEVFSNADTVLLAEATYRTGVSRVRLVGRRDGGTRWVRDVSDVQTWAVPGDPTVTPDEIALTSDSGAITVLGYADGAIRRTGQLHLEDPRGDSSTISPQLGITGNLLLAVRTSNEDSVTVVYRRDNLQELWHGTGYGVDCGPVICVSDELSMTGHDPVTGAVRWRRNDIAGAVDIGVGRVLVQSNEASDTELIIDAATGRTVGRPIRGETTSNAGIGPGAGTMLLLGQVVPVPGRAGDKAGQAPLVQLDLRTGAAFPLGTVDSISDGGCHSETGHLACWQSGVLAVYAVHAVAIVPDR